MKDPPHILQDWACDTCHSFMCDSVADVYATQQSS